MGDYCEPILAALWDPAQADAVFGLALAAIETAAGPDGSLSRDAIRTLPFTERVSGPADTCYRCDVADDSSSRDVKIEPCL